MREQNKKAIYGIISYSGGQYTIHFAKTQSDSSYTTSSLSGYGELPEEYNNIPIVNYKSNDSVFKVLSWNYVIVECNNPSQWDKPENILTVEEFLNRVHNIGIEILNWNPS